MSTGADILSNYTSMVSDIQADAKGEGPGVVGTVVDGIGDAANIASTVADPLAAVISAGVSWLVNHISFIKDPINQLLGDPQAIQQNTQDLDQLAQEISQIAQDHSNQVQQVQSGFSGQTADAFSKNMDQMSGQLGALSKTVEGTSTILGVSGGLVSAMHDIVLQAICDLISELIEGALIAAATAIISCGLSEVVYIGVAVGRSIAEVAKLGSKIAKLASALARMASRLSKLQKMAGDLSKDLDRFSNVGNAVETGMSLVNGGSGTSSDSTSDSDSDSSSNSDSDSGDSDSSDSDSGDDGSDDSGDADDSDDSDSNSYSQASSY